MNTCLMCGRCDECDELKNDTKKCDKYLCLVRVRDLRTMRIKYKGKSGERVWVDSILQAFTRSKKLRENYEIKAQGGEVYYRPKFIPKNKDMWGKFYEK